MPHFKSFTFDGRRSAHKALNKIEDAGTSYIWMEEGDVAEISVNNKGHYRVHSTWAQDNSNVPGGIGFGALCGGLIGLIFGPAGALAGAAVGGSLGGLIGHHDNVKFNQPVLDEFAQSLVPDSSALIILGNETAIAEFTAELAAYDVVTFETELDKDLEKALKEAMKK